MGREQYRTFVRKPFRLEGEFLHDRHGYVVSSGFPRVVAQGDTLAEALLNYCDALKAMVQKFGGERVFEEME